MAHFAQLDENNIVLQVIVVSNDDAPTEAVGIIFCQSLLGADTRWVQTSYNNNFRVRYAGIGFTYDSALDVFISPSPFHSWKLNSETTNWEAPVPYPDDGKQYFWDEETFNWVPYNVS